MGYLSDRCDSPKQGKRIYGDLAAGGGGGGVETDPFLHLLFPCFYFRFSDININSIFGTFHTPLLPLSSHSQCLCLEAICCLQKLFWSLPRVRIHFFTLRPCAYAHSRIHTKEVSRSDTSSYNVKCPLLVFVFLF